jgi:hypothetical protein
MKSKMVNTVYDCVLIDSPPQETELASKIGLWAFRFGTKRMPIEFDADIKVTKAWGEDEEESALDNILKSLNC